MIAMPREKIDRRYGGAPPHALSRDVRERAGP